MILVFGSLNVDVLLPVPRLPQPGETVLGGDYRLLPGGKGANQALAARRAGAAVAMVGAVGGDDFAEVALSGLRDAGVDLALVRRTATPGAFMRRALRSDPATEALRHARAGAPGIPVRRSPH